MREYSEKHKKILALLSERELLKQELLSAAIMDDEGMTDGENLIIEKEKRLALINIKLKELVEKD